MEHKKWYGGGERLRMCSGGDEVQEVTGDVYVSKGIELAIAYIGQKEINPLFRCIYFTTKVSTIGEKGRVFLKKIYMFIHLFIVTHCFHESGKLSVF